MRNRNINIDLLRIIAAAMIIVLHILGCGGILQAVDANTPAYWVAWFVEISAYCAVNIFAMISGYIVVDRSIKPKNVFNLWFQAIFYSLVISVIFFIFVPETRTIKNIIVSFFPVLGKQWWYLSAYFGLFLFIPLLNTAINNVPQKTFTNILVLLLLVFGIGTRVIPIDAFVLNNGYSTIWLMIMYLFGAYINKYSIHSRISSFQCILGFLTATGLTFLSKLTIHLCTEFIFGESKYDAMFVAYNSVTVVSSAVFLFLLCLNLQIGTAAKKVISILSPTSLGVYLIHVHPLIYNRIIKNAFLSFGQMPIAKMLLYILITAILLFGVLSAIDLLRLQIFTLIHIDKLSEKLGKKATCLSTKLYSLLHSNSFETDRQ